MPKYTYECPCGHKFDKRVPLAQMDEYQECDGLIVDPELDQPSPRVGRCRAPAKRRAVPSTPPHIIIR